MTGARWRLAVEGLGVREFCGRRQLWLLMSKTPCDADVSARETRADEGDGLFAITLGFGRHGTAPHDDEVRDGELPGGRCAGLLEGRTGRGFDGDNLPAGGRILRLQIKCFRPVEAATECYESNFHVLSAAGCLRRAMGIDAEWLSASFLVG